MDEYPEKFIVTLGSKGAMYLGKIFSSPKPQETIDVSGAGEMALYIFELNKFMFYSCYRLTLLKGLGWSIFRRQI